MVKKATKLAEMIECLAAEGYTMEDLAELIRKLDEVAIPTENKKTEAINAKLKEQVSNILKDLGIYPVQVGFDYLRTAIIIKYTSKTLIKQMDLYWRVACFYSKYTPSERAVAQNIKRAIEYGYLHGNKEAWHKYFDNLCVPPQGPCPKSHQFIEMITAYLQRQEHQV